VAGHDHRLAERPHESLNRIDSMPARTWFITGTSRGFGREWASAAQRRGDRVVCTAREPSTLAALVGEYAGTALALAMDVTDRAAVYETVARAQEHFGELDIVVNNAGYGQFGMIEELSEQEARGQIETNLFGALWVTQAALPFLCAPGKGHIVQVSSIGGISAFRGLGIYRASKLGLEGFSQALAEEVRDFGIHVTLIEPGGFSTDWGGSSAGRAKPLDAYREQHQARAQTRAAVGRGYPAASAEALMKVVDADPPPLRVFFGSTPLAIAERDYSSRLAIWRERQPVAELAQGDS
jgi:NAD(P)-dependent dehydrogenase (short-subunit alcohol dehydrogenase family)